MDVQGPPDASFLAFFERRNTAPFRERGQDAPAFELFLRRPGIRHGVCRWWGKDGECNLWQRLSQYQSHSVHIRTDNLTSTQVLFDNHLGASEGGRNAGGTVALLRHRGINEHGQSL